VGNYSVRKTYIICYLLITEVRTTFYRRRSTTARSCIRCSRVTRYWRTW